MTKAQGRRHSRNAAYYKQFADKLPAKKLKRASDRKKRQDAVAAGQVGSANLQKRRAKFAALKQKSQS